MELAVNILVIILAIIAFLILYYRTFSTIRKKGDRKMDVNKMDFETGREIGINSQEIQKTEKKRISQEIRKTGVEYELKDRYNKTFIRLFARDPNWLYAYWEVDNKDFYQNHPLLRLYNEREDNYFDIEIDHGNSDWYIGPLKADNDYKISIGYIKNETYFPIAYSRTIKTPADQPSDIIDEHWMIIEELVNSGYRIEADSLSIIRDIHKRKIAEELNADSYSMVNNVE